mmetsp:Transcript_86671/g.223236  ORF Transcript_86671/g.223236 Transcript_86671/m.223236 type:complete len:180 (-) Transcript_86671:12-551(-)
MTNVPLGPGGWYYEKGHRICVNGLAKATKMSLQGLFGEFGHIIKIETPQRGSAAYVSFKDKNDASEAVKYMDGETVDGQRISVSRAGDRPPPGAGAKDTEGKAESSSRPSEPAAPRPPSRSREQQDGGGGRGREKERRGQRGRDASPSRSRRRRSRSKRGRRGDDNSSSRSPPRGRRRR